MILKTLPVSKNQVKSMTKKWMTIGLSIIVFLCFIMFLLINLRWPSQARICQDLEEHIEKSECMKIGSRIQLINTAFTVGETTDIEINHALGAYLYSVRETDYGHIDAYHLEKKPIDYLLRYLNLYTFKFDKDGILIFIGYQDF